MTGESYYRWCLSKGIPTETGKGVCTVFLDDLSGIALQEAECRLPADAKEITEHIWQFGRAKHRRTLKKYPTYFSDIKGSDEYMALVESFRHIRTSPIALFQGEQILGPDKDRNTVMYWYIVELKKTANEHLINVPYIRTEDGFIALFKSRRKLG